jgi:hypothetical protein
VRKLGTLSLCQIVLVKINSLLQKWSGEFFRNGYSQCAAIDFQNCGSHNSCVLSFWFFDWCLSVARWNSRIWHCWRYNGRSEGLIHRGFGVLIGKNGTVKLVNIAPTEAPDRFRKPT